MFKTFSDLPRRIDFHAQRDPLPFFNWQATVHHGLPKELYSFHANQGKYLVFLGRVAPEKGLDQAIEIAKRVEMPLRIGAKIDPTNFEYYRAVIEPLLDHPLIEYRRRGHGSRERRLFGRCLCAVVSLRLARTVWPRLHRVAGLRYSGHCLPARLRP